MIFQKGIQRKPAIAKKEVRHTLLKIDALKSEWSHWFILSNIHQPSTHIYPNYTNFNKSFKVVLKKKYKFKTTNFCVDFFIFHVDSIHGQDLRTANEKKKFSPP